MGLDPLALQWHHPGSGLLLMTVFAVMPATPCAMKFFFIHLSLGYRVYGQGFRVYERDLYSSQ